MKYNVCMYYYKLTLTLFSTLTFTKQEMQCYATDTDNIANINTPYFLCCKFENLHVFSFFTSPNLFDFTLTG